MIPFVLSVETTAGTFTQDFPSGTSETTARQIAEDTLREKKFPTGPNSESRIVTVAVMQKRKILDVFDGTGWSSDSSPWQDEAS